MELKMESLICYSQKSVSSPISDHTSCEMETIATYKFPAFTFKFCILQSYASGKKIGGSLAMKTAKIHSPPPAPPKNPNPLRKLFKGILKRLN